MTEAQQRAYDQAQVMLAFSQGKRVECHIKDAHDSWCSVSPTYNLWEFDKLVFRIAPEPQEVWLWVHPDGKAYTVSSMDRAYMESQGYTKKLFREVC